MRDWVKPLRKAYFDCLDDNVLIDGSPIPVFQEKVADDEPNSCYIIIGETIATNSSDFRSWVFDGFVNVEIINMFQAESGDYVDDMTDQVKQLIFLTRTTFGIAQPAGFQITSMRLDGEQDIPILQTATGYIKRKILRIRQTIVDNN